MTRRALRNLWVALALAAAVVRAGAQTPPTAPAATPAAPAAPAAGAGLRTFLTMENVAREVFLLGRSGPDVIYRTPNAPPGVSATMKPDAIQRAEFDIKLDERQVFSLARRREWRAAAQAILPAIQPALPYLDLPENNAVEHAMTAGLYLRKAAQLAARGDVRAREDAPRFLTAAYNVLVAAGRASWHYYGDVARIRAVLCLIDLGRLDDAERELNRGREPEQGDAAYGPYWLARGELLFARRKYLEAMDAAVRAVLYETKDVETFPDALILTARCYEELNELHRTRDIYYEVARLFRGTDWGDLALDRLRRIQREGMASEKEEAILTAVFFGSDEDMDEIIKKFLEESGPEPKEVDVDAPPQEMGAETITEGAKP